MNRHEPLSELNEPLRQAVSELRSDTLPEASANRLLAEARGMDVSEESRPTLKRKRYATPTVMVLIATAAVILTAYISSPRETYAWEQVLKAISEQPWLLETRKANNRQFSQTWYGHDASIIAGKSSLGEAGNVYTFFNLENKTIDRFSERAAPPFVPEPGKVFRSAIRAGNRRGIDAAVRRYEATLLGQTNGMLIDSYEIDSQEIAEITKDGARLLEYRFKLRPAKEHHSRQIVVVVDPSTKLPVEKRVTSRSGDTGSMSFSFPRSGPVDIFELGVPRNTEVVDTRPNESVTRILDALRAGRTQMDPYFAVVTEGWDRDPKPRNADELLVWKDATRWRIEEFRKSERQHPVPDSKNPTRWWHNYVAGGDTAVKVISDGKSECTYSRDRSNGTKVDPNNPDYFLIEAYLEKIRPHRDPADPDAYSEELLAEWAAYPKLVYDGRFEIDTKPTEGPSETILFTMTYTDRIERLWLDPDRDYLTVRHDFVDIENGQNEGTQEILETIQTPSGKWLPSVLRSTVPLHNGGEQVRYKNFFFKFDVDLEQSMFEISDL